MYIEICGTSIRIGRVESDEIFLDDGERIFWAYGLIYLKKNFLRRFQC